MASKDSIGVNLRVTGHCNQGGRKYMEDVFCVAYQQTEDEKDLEFAFFGIFDGHGGREAALFAKEHLMDFVVFQKGFWSDDDEQVLKAIRDGFISTHLAMWKELDTWPRTLSGLPSTSGTTASIIFIRKKKVYLGHVGDSAIILGYHSDEKDSSSDWYTVRLTHDHKPESYSENLRIQQSGGKVICKSGVPRVVWNRPKLGHKGPVRRSTHIDEIPFLAVARSLGDLWSYNSELDQFIVSPEPDVCVFPIDTDIHKCIILGTDGLWNMVQPDTAVSLVMNTEKENEKILRNNLPNQWKNPSKCLVENALKRWRICGLRADNISVVTIMLDSPGVPNEQMMVKNNDCLENDSSVITSNSMQEPDSSSEIYKTALSTTYDIENENFDSNILNISEKIFNGIQSPEISSMNPELGVDQIDLENEFTNDVKSACRRILRSSALLDNSQIKSEQTLFYQNSSHVENNTIHFNSTRNIKNTKLLENKLFKSLSKSDKSEIPNNLSVNSSNYDYEQCVYPRFQSNVKKKTCELSKPVLRSRDHDLLPYRTRYHKARLIRKRTVRCKSNYNSNQSSKVLRLRTSRFQIRSDIPIK